MIKNTKRIPGDDEFIKIIDERNKDIQLRGEEHSVYDITGKIVPLKKAELWYDENCQYIKPKSSESLECIIN